MDFLNNPQLMVWLPIIALVALLLIGLAIHYATGSEEVAAAPPPPPHGEHH